LGLLFDLAIKKAGAAEKGSAETMEAVVEGIGRAVWRDVRNSARIAAASPDGDAHHLFRTALAQSRGSLHVVADGLGAVQLSELLKTQRPQTLHQIESLTLVAPAITIQEFEAIFAPLMVELGAEKSRVILPSKEFDSRMVTGPYPKSILHLIARSFEPPDKAGNAPVLAGTSEARKHLQKIVPGLSIATIEPTGKSMTLEHSALTNAHRVLQIIQDVCVSKTQP